MSESEEKSKLLTNPFVQLKSWMEDTTSKLSEQGEAGALATATVDGKSSIRMVNIRIFGENELIFFTDFESRKGQDLAENPHASLLFYWKELGRQVRVEGKVFRAPSDVSDEYFRKRPKESRLAVWASRQSRPLASQLALEKKMLDFVEKFPGDLIPRPEYWGGFRFVPICFEFWQERTSRLHERLVYIQDKNNQWRVEILSP